MPRATAQWKGDNAREIEHLLRRHVAHAEKAGDLCRITGANKLDITLNLGDRVVVDGDRLGVFRQTTQTRPDPEVLWTGINMADVAKFLIGYDVRVEVIGDTIFIHDARGHEKSLALKRGDKLIERSGMLIHSRGGKDHRV